MYLFKSKLKPRVACAAVPVNRRVIGTWYKDASRSTSMDAVSDLFAISGVVREAIKLIRGCEITIDDSHLRMGVFSVLPILKINEKYPMDGSEATNSRRDIRFGGCTGSLKLNDEGLPLLRLKWGSPYGGEGFDEFKLVTDDELHVISTVTFDGQTVSYTSVHTRKQ